MSSSRLKQGLAELLDLAARDSGNRWSTTWTRLGFEWVVVRDPHVEDLVTTVHLVSSDLIARGFGPQLLAAVFRFESRRDERPVYLLYAYKRGAFYPFIPTGENQRDNAREEPRNQAKLEGEADRGGTRHAGSASTTPI